MRYSVFDAKYLIWVVLAATAGCDAGPGPRTIMNPNGTPTTSPTTQDAARMVMDFKDPSAVRGWQAFTDSVIGGKSLGAIKSSGQGVAVFDGTISLEHGGFVMVRCPNGDYDLHGCTGVEIRLRGDGKRYKFVVKTSPEDNGFEYLADIWTEKETLQTVRVSFDSFKANWQGINLIGWAKIDPAKIVSMGFMIANYQEGPFRLEIESVKAWR
jgi:NADH dehydrogenase [ubiquinone] 1 alpha subcomplex assembly factor 1